MREPLQVVVGDSWHPKLLPYFAMCLMALMLITNVLNLKVLDIHGYTILSSSLTYVFSLVLTDIIVEVYGYRRVRRLVYVGLSCLAFYALCMRLAVHLPAPPADPMNPHFVTLFGQAPRLVIASLTAYFAVELINSFVMSRLKVRFRARYFFGRALVAVGLAQAVDCLIFFSIAFAGTMPLATWGKWAIDGWPIVVGCEVIILPLTRRLAIYVKSYEGVEHYDRAPPVNDQTPGLAVGSQ